MLTILVNWRLLRKAHVPAVADARAQYPRIAKYIEGGKGSGGGESSVGSLEKQRG
jgi:hypothetical protein